MTVIIEKDSLVHITFITEVPRVKPDCKVAVDYPVGQPFIVVKDDAENWSVVFMHACAGITFNAKAPKLIIPSTYDSMSYTGGYSGGSLSTGGF